MKNFNVVVVLKDGRALTGTNVKAESKKAVFEQYSESSVMYDSEDITSITVVEDKTLY